MSKKEYTAIQTTAWSDLTSSKKTRTYNPERVCQYEGCTMVLSKYNPNKYCYNHNKQVVFEEAIKAGTRRGK